MNRAIAIVVLAGVLHLAGCTTLERASSPQAPFEPESIQLLDCIVLTTTSGTKHRFEVRTVTPDAVCGRDRCFAANDTASVDREEIHPLANVLLAGTVGLMAAHGGFGRWGCLPLEEAQ